MVDNNLSNQEGKLGGMVSVGKYLNIIQSFSVIVLELYSITFEVIQGDTSER